MHSGRLVTSILQFYSHMSKNVSHFKCTEQKAPDNSEILRSFQNDISSEWNLLHVTFWCLEFVVASRVLENLRFPVE